MTPNQTNETPEIENLLKELSSISSVNQFATGVNNRPQLMFDAFQLFCQSHEALKIKNTELNSAHQRVHELEDQASKTRENGSTNQILSSLANALRGQSPARTMLIKDGEVFNGHKNSFYPWRESILLKLNSNADHFPDEQSKLVYIYSQMNLISKTHVQTWVKDGVLLFESVAKMMSVLDTIFGDPNRSRDAVNRLHANFQRNKPFSNWVVEIRRDAAIAGYDPSSQHLRDLVFYNMSIELKKALVHERDIDDLEFDLAISRLENIDNRQRAVANLVSKSIDRRGQFFRSPSYPTHNITPNNDAMDLSSAEPQRRGPLTKEEKDRRRRLGLCIYCAEKGHLLRSCPSRPQSYIRSMEFGEINDNESGKDQAL